jgi:hypothetical protein
MRRGPFAPFIKRSTVSRAAALLVVILGGCAQIVGIEAWKPADPCEDPGASQETCGEPMTCGECLHSKKAACEAAEANCASDAGSKCATIAACAEPCETATLPGSCVKDCCTMNGGDPDYDVYLTCMCKECEAVCGDLIMGCDTYCGM